MRCALIIPAWGPRDIFPAPTARLQANYWQPLGILYLAGSLLREGHEVRFFDGAFLPHAHLLQRIADWRPRLAGIYANTFLWKKAQETADHIKGRLPGIFTCAGGPHPTAVKDQGLLAATPNLDALVVGEGEATVTELAGAIEKGQALDRVSGLIFRRGSGVVVNPARPPAEDLDALAFPARELIEDPAAYVPPPGTYKRSPVATMLTSRGCPRQCIFCFQMDPQRTKVRYRSVENVLAEIEICLQQGYREIKFLDDTFTADYGRARVLTEQIRRRHPGLTWFASACVHQVDKPLLSAMKAAGCWAILFGAESGVQKNLDTLKKGITLEQTEKAVRLARQAGLFVLTPFLVGIPGETFQEGLETIAFACRLDPDMANFHTLTPFPGTDLYAMASRHGTLSADCRDFTFQGMAFIPHSMTRQEMERLRAIAFRAFYARPRYLARRALSVRTCQDVRNLCKGLCGLLQLWRNRNLFRRKPVCHE